MDAWRALFTTDAGLLSLGVIAFMLAMGGYMFWKFKRFIAEDEAKSNKPR
jgi:hypothetical protein